MNNLMIHGINVFENSLFILYFRSVKDLARLSLSNPHFISVHEASEHSTPAGLVQSYMVCELHDKMSLLWSFIKNHLHHKVLVFMSSCKQVRIMKCSKYLNRIRMTILPLLLF